MIQRGHWFAWSSSSFEMTPLPSLSSKLKIADRDSTLPPFVLTISPACGLVAAHIADTARNSSISTFLSPSAFKWHAFYYTCQTRLFAVFCLTYFSAWQVVYLHKLTFLLCDKSLFNNTHLSKWPSDLKINGTQGNVTFSDPAFHGLPCGVLFFAASVSLKNHKIEAPAVEKF